MAKAKSAHGYATGKSHPVDVHVGARLRARRTLLGMTQTDLGDAIGVTFQQAQKYENGLNRVSASRLFDLCLALDVPVDYFFDDMPPEFAVRSSKKRRGGAEELVSLDLMARRETLELVRAYYKIENAYIRKGMRELITVLGAGKGN